MNIDDATFRTFCDCWYVCRGGCCWSAFDLHDRMVVGRWGRSWHNNIPRNGVIRFWNMWWNWFVLTKQSKGVLKRYAKTAFISCHGNTLEGGVTPLILDFAKYVWHASSSILRIWYTDWQVSIIFRNETISPKLALLMWLTSILNRKWFHICTWFWYEIFPLMEKVSMSFHNWIQIDQFEIAVFCQAIHF